MRGSMCKREKEDPCVCNCTVLSHLIFLQLQSEERAKRHRPWPHADWLSSHPSKGIRGADGAVLYPEDDEGDASLQGG